MLKIDFVSDIACPWCAVGLYALESALRQLPDVPVQIRLQPFELNPAMGPEGEDSTEHLARKYGRTPAQLEETRAYLRERGEAVGFSFGPRTRIWNTFDGHRLLHWAGLQGRQLELKRALLKAYHADDLNPSDPAVLLAAAREAGLDEAEGRQVLEEGRYAEEVREQEHRWQRLGIQSVPSVIVNERYLIQGAQPPEAFMQALRRIADESGTAAPH
ncbi:DsbA family oxidoreductase [Azohydromonas caseinilytica]|uniref:DsbA family oxidoreductase n=1 Tax=Azohydromonas caseinilytica TaxID=2728836 RepID=A0A848FFJ7_9BURK|nr:DsbA family oxidoreductase [Azohydromonas caseinilytica]NML17615.1 DsbA family oxidoreductase [Azohydromonas caseinilytica]